MSIVTLHCPHLQQGGSTAGLEVPSQQEICTLSTSKNSSPGSNDQLSDCLIGGNHLTSIWYLKVIPGWICGSKDGQAWPFSWNSGKFQILSEKSSTDLTSWSHLWRELKYNRSHLVGKLLCQSLNFSRMRWPGIDIDLLPSLGTLAWVLTWAKKS